MSSDYLGRRGRLFNLCISIFSFLLPSVSATLMASSSASLEGALRGLDIGKVDKGKKLVSEMVR